MQKKKKRKIPKAKSITVNEKNQKDNTIENVCSFSFNGYDIVI